MAAFAISRKTRGTLNSPYLLDHNCICDLNYVYWTSNWSHIFLVQIRYSNTDSNNKRMSNNWSAENTIQIKLNLCHLRQSGRSSLKECPVYLISHLHYNLPEKQSWIAGFEKCSRFVWFIFIATSWCDVIYAGNGRWPFSRSNTGRKNFWGEGADVHRLQERKRSDSQMEKKNSLQNKHLQRPICQIILLQKQF